MHIWNSTMHRPTLPSLTAMAASISTAILLACGLAGCGSSSAPVIETPPPNSYPGVTFGGKTMAGKLPLIGASVQLYAAGTSGNGSTGTALLSTALTTDANGAFTVPAGYSCPSATSQLYIIARGGKPGAAATSANSAATLLTTLGYCNQVIASSQIVVNEVTTVAGVYALSQFLSAGANLGASATNTTGLGNAFTTASVLADTSQGTSPGPGFAANGTSPAQKIDSIANLLNGCVASTVNGSACTALFSATTPIGGFAPTNTLDAALNLTRNPGANVASLYALSASSSAFSPALAAAPSDWTLFVNYTGGGMNSPSGLGIDSAGNVWVASYFNVASLFSPLGKPLLPQGVTGSGLSASYGLAVDENGDAWIPNEPNPGFQGNSVSVFNSSGQSVAGSGGFTSGGLNYPIAVAIDTDGSTWVADYGNSHLTHLSSSGQTLSGTAGYTSPLLAFPDAVAIDGNHYVWVADQSPPSGITSAVIKVSPDGSQFTDYPCGDGPAGLAIDQLGNVWVANYYGNSISELSNSGADLSKGGYTGGGIDHPQGIAIDGAGNAWIANYRSAYLTELAGASAATPGAVLSPSGGLGMDANLLEAYKIAVDASGNLWISNFGSNILTQFVGLAPPVRTPSIGLPVAP
jgi:streptogramin lyase